MVSAYSSLVLLVGILLASVLYLRRYRRRSAQGINKKYVEMHRTCDRVRKKDPETSEQETSTKTTENERRAKRSQIGLRNRKIRHIRFRNMMPEQDIEINSTEAVAFQTDQVAGKVLLMVRPRRKEDECEWIHGKHFSGRRRRFEMQVQLKFKKIPKGHVVMGGQLRKRMNLGFLAKSLGHAILRIIRTIVPGVGDRLHFSFGSSAEVPHIVFPFRRAAAAMIITPEGEAPPRLGAEICETPQQKKQRRNGEMPAWNTSSTYTFALHTPFVDLNDLKVVNLGVGTVDLRSFWGQSVAEFVAYAIPEKQRTEAHSEDRKLYLFRFSVEVLAEEDIEVEDEDEDDTILDAAEDENEDRDEGIAVVAWIEIAGGKSRVPDRFVICSHTHWAARTWLSCSRILGAYLKRRPGKALTRQRKLRVREKQLERLRAALTCARKKKSGRAAIYELLQTSDGPPMLRTFPGVNKMPPASSSAAVQTPAVFLFGARHWIQGTLVLEKTSSVSRIRLLSQQGDVWWERSIMTVIRCTLCEPGNDAFRTLHMFEVETLGRVFVFVVQTTQEASTWAAAIRQEIAIARTDDAPPPGWAVDGIADPREVFIRRRNIWAGGQRQILNARRMTTLRSSPPDFESLGCRKPAEIAAKLLQSVLCLNDRDKSACTYFVEYSIGAERREDVKRWNARDCKNAQTEFASFMDALAILRSLSCLRRASPKQKFCFWVNIYHTLLVHITLLFGPPLPRWKLWKSVCYEIDGEPFSLLEIEHCILRANSSRPRGSALSRLFLPSRPLPGSVRCTLAEGMPADPRLNFVLNTGSISCLQSITVLREHSLDALLDRASSKFLETFLKVNTAKRCIVLPPIMSWYKRDFAPRVKEGDGETTPRRATKLACAMFALRLLRRCGRRDLDLERALLEQDSTAVYGKYEWKICHERFTLGSE